MTVATFAAAQLLRVLPRAQITRAVGRLCDAPIPRVLSSAVVGLYAKAYNVDLAASVAPDGVYPSFDAFFTRPLRDGQRPICPDPDAIVSPADGRVESFGPITEGGRFKVKGKDYSAADLVGDEADARRYEGGQFAVVYLSPRDYHRVHSPVSGATTLVRSMPGDYFPVNSIGERHVPALFARNRRVAIVIDTPSKGRVTVVMVSAMIVGRITVSAVSGHDVPFGTHTIDPPRAVERGDEIGIFHMGSTAVVFVEKHGSPPWRRETGPIRFGEPLDGARTP